MNKNTKTALIIGGIIVAILVVLPIVFGAFGFGMMGPWMMGGYGWGWFMPIVMVVFWGLVIWGIVALVRGLSTGSSAQSDSALDILKKRYARGEINKQEYEEKKKDLT